MIKIWKIIAAFPTNRAETGHCSSRLIRPGAPPSGEMREVQWLRAASADAQSRWFQTSVLLSSLYVPWTGWLTVFLQLQLLPGFHRIANSTRNPSFYSTRDAGVIKSDPINESSMHHRFIQFNAPNTFNRYHMIEKASPTLFFSLFTQPAAFPSWPFSSRLAVSRANAHISWCLLCFYSRAAGSETGC